MPMPPPANKTKEEKIAFFISTFSKTKSEQNIIANYKEKKVIKQDYKERVEDWIFKS